MSFRQSGMIIHDFTDLPFDGYPQLIVQHWRNGGMHMDQIDGFSQCNQRGIFAEMSGDAFDQG
ncbi:MAG: hypothetical protein H6650_18790 [Ardenticatenales bacterium]|nr:hypothetical protein [Ardenticatenales bacterium]